LVVFFTLQYIESNSASLGKPIYTPRERQNVGKRKGFPILLKLLLLEDQRIFLIRR
jgi:hypothetical protein